MEESMDYRRAGVDIDAGEAAVERIKGLARSTYRKGVLQDLGGFGGMFALNFKKYRRPVLVSGCDGVGTKLKVAFATNRHATVGIDCVAMCVNDLLVQGAEPLFFLDYLAVGKLFPEQVEEIISGVARGCRMAGCALLGGETAEMPGFYPEGEYDLAGFAVGILEEEELIDGSSIVPGDVIIGLASTGLHSNGYSLARKVLLEKAQLSLEETPAGFGQVLGEELLKPTCIYVPYILPLLKKYRIKGMAHITGGGLPGNIPRILPPGTRAVLNQGSWRVSPIFNLIQELGPVSLDEMYRTFNMGLGYILVTTQEFSGPIIDDLREAGISAWLTGYIEAGEKREVLFK